MTKSLITLGTLILLAVTFGCGGGGGGGSSSGSSTGTFSMSITDAKPMLPESSGKITNVFVTIDGVFVHKSGGGWLDLTPYLPNSPDPFVIDLLHYHNGFSTHLVPPVALESGKYTQVRLSVTEARLKFADNSEIPLTIPSENLKTDKNFEFDVGGTAVDITIDFVLSKSIVVEGPAGTPSYKLKPVLHIVKTEQAATIEGTISNVSFLDGGDTPYVVITVLDSTGQEYTKVQVEKDGAATDNKTSFSIFWIVPDQDYEVEIDYDPVTNPGANLADFRLVDNLAVEPGETAYVCFPVTVQDCP